MPRGMRRRRKVFGRRRDVRPRRGGVGMNVSGLSTVRLGRMREVLTGHVARGELPGLVALVARRGEVQVEAIGTTEFGGGPMRRDAIFRIASVTKLVTAAAAMILVEECRLRLDDPVDELLPELANRRVFKQMERPLEGTLPAPPPHPPHRLLTVPLWHFVLL